jgi:hypothetical protein
VTSCLRSGYCCKKATCAVGRAHGAPPTGCTFLRGERPGEYSCALATKHPEPLAIGAGCCLPLNTTRRELHDAS